MTNAPTANETPRTLEQALDWIPRHHAPVTGGEEVPLAEACGRILADDLLSTVTVPPAAVSAMDGYGVGLAAPTAAAGFRATVVDRVPAGSVGLRPIGAGQAVRVFTGTMLPPGVDTVLIQEDCRLEDRDIVLECPVPQGANIRPMGEDLNQGTRILRAGTRLRAQEVGLAAAAGHSGLTVRRRLRVAILSTGSELREPGTLLVPGTIYDANRHALAALARGLGAGVDDHGILPDRLEAVTSSLSGLAARYDLVITSGGMSVGEEDHVKAAVRQLGRIDLWKLALRPGKPVAFGRIGDTPFLGLPGNPVSAMVTFMLLGRPLILTLSGAPVLPPPRYPVGAGFDFRKKPGRQEFLRGWLEADGSGGLRAQRFPSDSSGVLSSMVRAEGLIDVPADSTGHRVGDTVHFIPFTAMG